MSLPLDQQQLIAGVEELERRLRQSPSLNGEGTGGAEAPVAPEPGIGFPEINVSDRHQFNDQGATGVYYDDYPDDPTRRRRLILAASGVIVLLFVGAMGVALTFLNAPANSPNATAPDREAKAVSPSPDVASAPEAQSLTPVTAETAPPPVEAAKDSRQAPPATARLGDQGTAPSSTHFSTQPQPAAAPAPVAADVATVTIMPDGSLAPADAISKDSTFARLATPGVAGSTPGAPVAQPDVAAPPATSSDLSSQNPQGQKAPKKKVAKRAAKPNVAKTETASPAEQAPAHAAAPAGDGFLQGAQRAFGSVTGAVKKLVGSD